LRLLLLLRLVLAPAVGLPAGRLPARCLMLFVAVSRGDRPVASSTGLLARTTDAAAVAGGGVAGEPERAARCVGEGLRCCCCAACCCRAWVGVLGVATSAYSQQHSLSLCIQCSPLPHAAHDTAAAAQKTFRPSHQK
jgi:hypothetical protein